MINGAPFGHSEGFGAGLAATNDMAVDGIKAGDNLLSVISWTSAGAGTVVGHDITDFTVSAGALNAATIDLSSRTFVATWTEEPAA